MEMMLYIYTSKVKEHDGKKWLITEPINKLIEDIS